ncbi:MAG: hypothetical protein ACPL09_06010 [Candidatus Methanodesulfokora sp.]
MFTFEDAEKFLQMDRSRLSVAFSRLHRNRILLIFERRKQRLYRLIDPEGFILLASGLIRNLDRIKQERYIKLLCDAVYLLNRSFRLTSIALYGSVARGTGSELCSLFQTYIALGLHQALSPS